MSALDGVTPGTWEWAQEGPAYTLRSTTGSRVLTIREGVIPMNADGALLAKAPALAADNAALVALLREAHEVLARTFPLADQKGRPLIAHPTEEALRLALEGRP